MDISNGEPLNKIIKEERIDEPEEEEQIVDSIELHSSDFTPDPKSKMKKLQAALSQVTERIEFLEREVVSRREEVSAAREHEGTVVTLLSGILEEMKKMNGCKCRAGGGEEEAHPSYSDGLALAREGKMQVTIADGTIAVQTAPPFFKKWSLIFMSCCNVLLCT